MLQFKIWDLLFEGVLNVVLVLLHLLPLVISLGYLIREADFNICYALLVLIDLILLLPICLVHLADYLSFLLKQLFASIDVLLE